MGQLPRLVFPPHSKPAHETMTNSARRARVRLSLAAALGSIALLAVTVVAAPRAATQSAEPQQPDRSPVDLVLTADEQWLITANQTSGTVSLVEVATGRVVQEVPVGEQPTGLALLPGGEVLVTATWAGDLVRLKLEGGRLRETNRMALGPEPYGVTVSHDGQTAYVSLAASAEVAEIDLAGFAERRRIGVGQWPRQMALSPDSRLLAVGCSGSQTVAVIDTQRGELLFQESTGGINLGQMQVDARAEFVYLPWMVYRQYPVTAQNIRRGWVIASRIGRMRLDGPARRQAISLDVPGQAVSDPHGLGLTTDEQWIVATAAGTHELLVYRAAAVRFQDYGGPGDLIDTSLARDPRSFYRIPLGGRPMNLRIARDDRHVYVANYLENCVQVVDLAERAVVRSIELGGPTEPSLARQGEAIFYDGRRSLDQWYSCHTCHWEGGTNAVTVDTRNDGTDGTFKTVLPLYHVAHTAPWTWHGWQTDLGESLRKSLVESMLGPRPSQHDVDALLAYLQQLSLPPNPHRSADGSLPPSAQRGKLVFESEIAGCTNCHNGPYLTDGEIHDLGLGRSQDVYQGFNTPSLLGVYRRVRLMHDGRSRSLEELLTGPHNPAEVTGLGPLTDTDLADLIEYLKTR